MTPGGSKVSAHTQSRRIAIGVAAGVATGLFLGDAAAILQPIADGYIRLLQMTVLPYVTIADHQRPRRTRPGAGEDAGQACRPDPGAAVGRGACRRARWSDMMFPRPRERLVLQHDAARGARSVRLPRPLHSDQPVQLARQQHRAGGRAVQHRRRAGADRRAEQGRAARRADASPAARSRARRDFIVSLTPYRRVRHCRGRRRHARPR